MDCLNSRAEWRFQYRNIVCGIISLVESCLGKASGRAGLMGTPSCAIAVGVLGVPVGFSIG